MRYCWILLILPVTAAHFDSSECDKTKKCVSNPPDCITKETPCHTVFTYRSIEDDWIEMELWSSRDEQKNEYIAAAFSEDNKMGNDYVTQCEFPSSGEKPQVHVSYNFGKVNKAPTAENDMEVAKNNLEMIHAHSDGSEMYCQYKQRTLEEPNQFVPNLKRPFVIFTARGKLRGPRALSIHGTTVNSPEYPAVSNQMITVAEQPTVPTNSTQQDNPSHGMPMSPKMTPAGWWSNGTRVAMVKTHGILMLLGWLVLIALGILAARYLRDHWAGHTPGGLKWWFHLHRTLNYLAIFLIAVSTFLIFLAKEFAWKGPVASQDRETNLQPGPLHSLFGVMAVIGSILQPIMAMMRCDPDTGARPLFNWSHRTLGVITFIFAIIATVIAVAAFSSLWSDADYALSLLLLHLGITVIAVIAFEILSYMKTRVEGSDLEMHQRRGQFDSHGRVYNNQKTLRRKPMFGLTILYTVYGIFAVAVVVLLILMLLL